MPKLWLTKNKSGNGESESGGETKERKSRKKSPTHQQRNRTPNLSVWPTETDISKITQFPF